MSNQSQTRGSALPPNQLAGSSEERHGPIVAISLLSAAAATAETSQLNRESFKVLFLSQCNRPFLLSVHLFFFVQNSESKHKTGPPAQELQQINGRNSAEMFSTAGFPVDWPQSRRL